MMMYFEFNEDKLKQNNLTKEQCFRVIDKVIEYSTHSEPHRPALRATYSIF